jgi:hypothetical protein
MAKRGDRDSIPISNLVIVRDQKVLTAKGAKGSQKIAKKT